MELSKEQLKLLKHLDELPKTNDYFNNNLLDFFNDDLIELDLDYSNDREIKAYKLTSKGKATVSKEVEARKIDIRNNLWFPVITSVIGAVLGFIVGWFSHMLF